MPTVKQLKKTARELGVKGYYNMKKQELLNAIYQKEEESGMEYYTLRFWGSAGSLSHPYRARNLSEIMRHFPAYRHMYKNKYQFFQIIKEEQILRTSKL